MPPGSAARLSAAAGGAVSVLYIDDRHDAPGQQARHVQDNGNRRLHAVNLSLRE